MAETKTPLQNDTDFYTSPDLPDDIAMLRAESLRLDAIIQKLNIRRSLVLQKLNSLESTTQLLPSEVLSTIFMHAYPPPSFSPRINLKSGYASDPDATGEYRYRGRKEMDPGPVVLGAVCSRWRRAAWDSPEIWSALDLRPRATNSRHMEAGAALLQLYASNASVAGLDVQIVFSWPHEHELGEYELADLFPITTRPLANTLFSQDLLVKTRTLVLSNPPPTWIPDLSKGFVNLRTFVLIHTMSGCVLDIPSITLTNVPSLRHVSLENIWECNALPLDQLQSLNLREIPLDEAFKLLVLCPNLTSYRSYWFRSRLGNPSQDTVQLNNPMTLPNIQHLEWSGSDPPMSRQFQYIRLPGLRYLQLHSDTQHLDLVDFCSALPNDLETFHLTGFRDSDYKLVKALLVCIPQLKTLILNECDYLVFINIVRLLEPEPLPHNRTSALPIDFLPNLRSLRIEDISTSGDFSEEFATVLKTRMEKTNMDREFKLEFVRTKVMTWSSRAKKILRDLIVNDGAPLKIFDGEEEMTWD